MEDSELHELQEIPIADFWRLGSCCYTSRIAAGLHEGWLFIVQIGQLSKKRDWPSRQSMEMETKNVQHLLLVELNILLPPLHIKQGLIKNFVGTTDQIAPAFRYLAEKFPGISATKIKEGVFINSQIRMLYRVEQDDGILSVMTRQQ
jgi:hypothetical protein